MSDETHDTSTRVRITVEFWDDGMNYAIESIYVGIDPARDTDEGRALAKAVEMHDARMEAWRTADADNQHTLNAIRERLGRHQDSDPLARDLDAILKRNAKEQA